MASLGTELQAIGGNNVGIVVPEEVVLAFERGKGVPVTSRSTAATPTKPRSASWAAAAWSPSTPKPADKPAAPPGMRSRSG